MFFFIAGNIGLDFCNTEIADRGEIVNLLNTPQDLLLWAQEAGMPLAAASVGDISKVLELRQAIKHLVHAKLEGVAPKRRDIATVNQYLMPTAASQELKYNHGAFVLDTQAPPATAQTLLRYIALEAVRLLPEAQKYPIKKCANPHCILHFLDKSRTRQRKWCSMEVCGNREKVSAHHKRSKAP